MKKLLDFEQYNESIGSLFLGFIAGWFMYKFLKNLRRDMIIKKMNNQIVNIVTDHIKKLRSMKDDNVGISEYTDRYFIRFNRQNIGDIRIMKDTKELLLDKVKINLSDEQYNDFIEIINNVQK
jgi:hypothetical protein